MARLEQDIRHRQEMVEQLTAALRNLHNVHIIAKTVNVNKAHYIRFPILVGAGQRDIILAKLMSRGFEASPMYIEYGMQVDATRYPGAARVAHELLTLPCHPYMGSDDIASIAEIFTSHFTSSE